jgi:gliding motility-associated protein GldM
MAGVASNPNSPRQKMINLMYLVFIAMMALNVSSEVLEGFELVEASLSTSTQNSTRRNEEVMANLDHAYQENAAKVGEWYEKGVKVKEQSDELYNFINELKLRIVLEADGKKGDVNDIVQKDNLEAASRVMLAPIVGEGKNLKERIETYRTSMSDLVGDPGKQAMFEIALSTEAPRKGGIIAPSWESTLFENMPVAAAITLLTKIQSDIRFVEGETLSTLINNVDVGDYRVNKIQAFIVPKSQIVTSGMPYEAQIVLAAVDSTKQPEYYLGTTLLKNNLISIGTSGTGDREFSGKVIADGETYPFSAKYSVTESSATIAPVLMTFLYETIENDLAIAMPGVPSGAVTASLKGQGSIVFKEKNIWTVKGLSVSSDKIEVVLSANVGGRTVTASQEFKVRSLPDPLGFISYKDKDGRTSKFTGGSFSKRNLIEATGVDAAIDDNVLYVPYTVTGFTLFVSDSFCNIIPEVSPNAQFTARQKELIRNLSSGKRFFFGDIKTLDPGGKPLLLKSSLQVLIVN